ncbi:MAG: 4Fe-4S dicluster domain-containing protein [Bacteroidales bacterium]|jgi:heterodisulfide reductase subunit C|nr:4Fe-4S dicluster domain-containing protein [Bacteroidales bacterium]
MIDFGYKKNESTKIDLDSATLDLYDRLLIEEPSIAFCISCGTCTATCSAGQFTDFNLRKIMLLCKRGETQSLKPIINRCMVCGKCQFACPKGVNTRHIVLTLNKHLHEGTIA